jgi:hypothetical protein
MGSALYELRRDVPAELHSFTVSSSRAGIIVADQLAFVGFHQYSGDLRVGLVTDYVHAHRPHLPVVVTEYTSFRFGDLDAGQEVSSPPTSLSISRTPSWLNTGWWLMPRCTVTQLTICSRATTPSAGGVAAESSRGLRAA